MIPIKKGITGADIPNIAVETSETTIPRKPILVEGGPAPEPITVTALTVTENGTHDAGENAAYNPVTVNVDKSKPDEIELVDFDFTNYSLLDKIRNFSIPSQNVQNLATGENGIKFNGTNSSCNIAFIPETNSFYEIKIKFGTNAETVFAQYNAILKLNRTDNHFTVTYCRDVTIAENPTGTWRISDSGIGAIYLNVGYGDPHYFDNKELKIEYGYYYNNGVFTPNLNKYSLSINGEYIHISNGTFFISGSSGNANPIILLGGGSAVMKGTIIESVKIKQLFKWNLDRALFRKFALELEESEVR
jgi:hypothetical protein